MSWILNKFKTLGFLVMFFGSLFAILAVVVIGLVLNVPDVGMLERCMTTSMYRVRLCPGGDNYVRIKEISPYVLHAVIAAEDGSFYNHRGFDWHEIRESMQANISGGGFRRGGSTLTQQLAKNVFLDKEKSLWRKVKEAYLANGIENRYDKNFILEKYLNVVEFGDNLYGIKPAAQHYFHKSPSALHPLEAAWLAMLLPNPKKYSQSFRKGQLTPFARKMVGIILKRMQSFGKLSPAAYQTAMASIDQFPWNAISLAQFGGGSYSLETDVPASAVKNEAPLDENALENLLEEENNAPPTRAGESNPVPETDGGSSDTDAIPDDFE